MLHLLDQLMTATAKDAKRGLTAHLHDESQMNRAMATEPPTLVLAPSYLYPEPSVVNDGWCPNERRCERDEMHPWLWTPWRPHHLNGTTKWSKREKRRKFPVHVLNLTKDKMALINAR